VLAGILLAGCPDKKPSGSTPPDEDVPAPADVLDVVDIVDVEPELELPPVDTEEPFEIGYLHPVSPVEAEDLDPAEGVVEVALTAAAIQLETPDGLLDGYAFNGQVPGPTIRAKKGDTLRVTLTNHLLTPTTIHWHGIRVPWAMDGITWQQDPVAPNDSFVYEFPLDQAGTFWFHPHFDSHSQVDLGLQAALIVEDPADPKPDHEAVLIFDGFGEKEHSEIDEEHVHSHARTLIKDWVINGAVRSELKFPAGSTVRVRMFNTSNAGYLDLRWPSMRQLGEDQGLLSALRTPERILLAPGDRADVEWLIGDEPFTVKNHPYSLQGGEAYADVQDLFQVVPVGEGAAPAGLAWPFPGGEPTPDPGHADVVYVFAGSDHTGKWLMNGEVYPEITVAEIPANQAFVMEVRNVSPTEHPFHLHGVFFEVLSVNGVAPEYRRIEDTINLAIQDTIRLGVVADNPGDWMAHCHILPHAHGGMMTVIRFLE
jgi:FtsP/CotA-like multicopper oxidase with cupredoxin domain